MKIPVFIVNSMQFQNPCKAGDKEANHTRAMAVDAYTILKADERLEVGLCPVVQGKDQAATLDLVEHEVEKFAMKFLPIKTIVISFHTNAGGGTGVRVFYNSADKVAKALAETIHYELAQVTSQWSPDGAVAYDGAHEMRTTLEVSHYALVEALFHDDPAQAKFIHEKNHLLVIATLRGLYRSLKLQFSEELNVEILKEIKVLSEVSKWLKYQKGGYSKPSELVDLASNYVYIKKGVRTKSPELLADYFIDLHIAGQKVYWVEALTSKRQVPSSVTCIIIGNMAR